MVTMKRFVFLFAGLLGVCGGYTPVWATPYNVALNANVTLDGTFFSPVGSWNGSYPDRPATPAAQQAHANTVTDGVFFPDNWQWNNGTTWWDSHNGLNQHVVIDLKGVFNIKGFIVQADDNEAYLLEYRDLTSMTWKTAWNVPNFDWDKFGKQNWGLQTRPNEYKNSEWYLLPQSITTNALRFSGVGGDMYYAVSEIQALGEAAPVPEPATLLLLGAGLAGLACAIRMKKK